ncbi:MAG: hypothetical protein OES18_06590, partial [Deltaproteobacteria bacterium]|nr:hypothetical protein [Deltaproteobacteria bacterium]
LSDINGSWHKRHRASFDGLRTGRAWSIGIQAFDRLRASRQQAARREKRERQSDALNDLNDLNN